MLRCWHIEAHCCVCRSSFQYQTTKMANRYCSFSCSCSTSKGSSKTLTALFFSCLKTYRVSFSFLQSGSKEESVGNDTANSLIEALDSIGLGDDVLVDDRITETLGKRLVDAQKLGIPFIIVCGRKSPEVELHDLIAGDVMSMPLNQAIQMVDGKNNNVITAKKLNAMWVH